MFIVYVTEAVYIELFYHKKNSTFSSHQTGKNIQMTHVALLLVSV